LWGWEAAGIGRTTGAPHLLRTRHTFTPAPHLWLKAGRCACFCPFTAQDLYPYLLPVRGPPPRQTWLRPFVPLLCALRFARVGTCTTTHGTSPTVTRRRRCRNSGRRLRAATGVVRIVARISIQPGTPFTFAPSATQRACHTHPAAAPRPYAGGFSASPIWRAIARATTT